MAVALSVATLMGYAAYLYGGAGQTLYEWSKSFAPYEEREWLGMSKRYLLQYGHIFFLTLLLFLSRYVFVADRPLPLSGPMVERVAKYTIPIFLIHFPILFFLAAVTDYNRSSPLDQLTLLVAVFILSILFGRLCFAIKPRFDRTQARWQARLDEKFPRPNDLVRATSPLKITQSHSDLLNLVKIIAAFAVVLGHFSFSEFTIYKIPGFDGSAPRFAVPAFFMISGYFMMLSIDRSRAGAAATIFKRYWSLYYLIVPMLLLVPILDNIGYAANAGIYRYDEYYVFQREQGPAGVVDIISTYVNSLLYLNEFWIYNLIGFEADVGGVRAFSNDPYWFLCYLMPFSVILAVARLMTGTRRLWIMAIWCLLLGPPVLLLAPLFFSGCLAYYMHQRIG
ncbi:MAG: acyltransferase family protein [Pseudomonadota bacterium]